MKTANDVLKTLKDKDVKFVDLRFTDTKGKMQHVTADVTSVDEGMFQDGYASTAPRSPAGRASRPPTCCSCRTPPRASRPFFAQTTMAVFCDVIEPSTGQLYERDRAASPRRPRPT